MSTLFKVSRTIIYLIALLVFGFAYGTLVSSLTSSSFKNELWTLILLASPLMLPILEYLSSKSFVISNKIAIDFLSYFLVAISCVLILTNLNFQPAYKNFIYASIGILITYLGGKLCEMILNKSFNMLKPNKKELK
jgi:hypothetical protein